MQPAFDSAALAAEKRALRQICRAKLSLLTPPGQDTAARVCAALRSMPEYLRARTVFCYISVKAEADTHPFLRAALADGKTVCAPWCAGPGVMYAKQLAATRGLEDLEGGAYGIPAPPASAATVSPMQIDFAVLPCLAADAQGNRLGHGGGFYDRFLQRLSPTAATVVLCRAALLLPVGQIPLAPHDIPAHTVLTV